jgi:hypothetical protein
VQCDRLNPEAHDDAEADEPRAEALDAEEPTAEADFLAGCRARRAILNAVVAAARDRRHDIQQAQEEARRVNMKVEDHNRGMISLLSVSTGDAVADAADAGPEAQEQCQTVFVRWESATMAKRIRLDYKNRIIYNIPWCTTSERFEAPVFVLRQVPAEMVRAKAYREPLPTWVMLLYNFTKAQQYSGPVCLQQGEHPCLLCRVAAEHGAQNDAAEGLSRQCCACLYAWHVGCARQYARHVGCAPASGEAFRCGACADC